MDTASCSSEIKGVKTCVVCNNAIHEPRYLNCLHSFCKLCIRRLPIRKLGRSSYLRCPVCEDINKITDLNTDKWIDELPESTFNTSNSDYHCEPCKEREKTTKADLYCAQCKERLCVDCTSVHQSMKISKNHTILLLEKVVSVNTGGIFCPKHQSKVLSVFCISHRTKCCPTCRIIDHLNCNVTKARTANTDHRYDVIPRATIAEQCKLLQERGTDDQLSTAFSNIFKVLENKTKDCHKRRENLETQRASCNENIQNICFKLEDVLQRVKTLRPVLDSEFRNHIEHTHTEEQIIREQETFVKDFQNALEESKRSSSDILRVVTAEHLNHQKYKIERFIASESRGVAHTLQVEYDKILVKLLDVNKTDPISFITTEVPLSVRCRLLTHCVPSKVDEMSLTWSSRQHGVTQIMDLSENRILLVDNTCKEVYIYNSRDKIESLFELDRKPWTAILLKKELFVTVTTVYLKTINLDKLDFGKDFYMPGLVRCVAYYKEKFVVTTESQVQVLNRAGNMLRSFKVDNPRYIYVDRRDRFYFRNGVRNTLYCTSDDFKILFAYSHPELKVIGGITLDSEDNIYVVGHLSNNIHQLFPDGSFNRILLTEKHGLFKPIYIHFIPGSDKFLLSNDGGNTVEVYQMD